MFILFYTRFKIEIDAVKVVQQEHPNAEILQYQELDDFLYPKNPFLDEDLLTIDDL